MLPPARDTRTRIEDTLAHLTGDVDCWLATADPTGTPHLIPISFLWADGCLLVSTAAGSPTARNLTGGGAARVALGTTRDVVMIEVTAETIQLAELSQELGDEFAAQTEFEPRELATPYLFFRLRPERVQAWREVNEIEGRTLMRAGTWLDPTAS